MECEASWPSNSEFLLALSRKAAQQRVPMSGSIALTHRCNLSCIHCFVRNDESGFGSLRPELSTVQFRRVLDEVVEAGCLSLLLTGGEPLLRPDFGEIYRHARSNGLMVSIFTNGTLVTERQVALFRELPPRSVEMTIYGASAGTYERVTGVAGSFERFLAGFRRLLEAGVSVRLKTMLMTLNKHELVQMEQFAEASGVPFRFDACITPRLNGDLSPLTLRVSPEEAIEAELAGGRVEIWRDYISKRSLPPLKETVYDCGAGMINFHVDATGRLMPCQMTNNYGYDLTDGSFAEGWRQAMPIIRSKKAEPSMKCWDCEKRLLCSHCPAASALETGSEEVPATFLCTLGQLRHDRVVCASGTGRNHDQ